MRTIKTIIITILHIMMTSITARVMMQHLSTIPPAYYRPHLCISLYIHRRPRHHTARHVAALRCRPARHSNRRSAQASSARYSTPATGRTERGSFLFANGSGACRQRTAEGLEDGLGTGTDEATRCAVGHLCMSDAGPRPFTVRHAPRDVYHKKKAAFGPVWPVRKLRVV